MRLRHVNAGLDLVRCESLQSLDNDTCARLLEKNYGLLVTMAPLSKEVRPIVTHQPPHLGPPTQDVNSIWFKLYLYHITGSGPSSILFTRGTRVRKLPKVLKSCERVLVTLWGHDPTVIPLANLVFALNDALFHSPVLVQAYGSSKGADIHMLPFPFINDSKDNTKWCSHPAVDKVSRLLDLKHTCGYLTMVRLKRTPRPGSLPPPLWGVAKVDDKVRQFLNTSESANDKVGQFLQSADDKVGQFLNTSDLSPQPSTSPSSISDATWVHRPPGNESPVNGITDKESAHILEEELDGLTEAEACGSSKSSPCRETVESKDVKSSWTEIGNCAADKRKDDSVGELSDWMLLECLFGVPLFEAEINQKICDTIVNRLADKASLEQLVISNQKLGKNLEEFIVQFQDLNKICTPQMFSPSQSSVPWPATNLMFVNGEIKEWDRQ
ncbi:hypothetical protein LSTR_LSTR011368 [Laodelphax striatellus]|uniref:FAM91 C-terminal domain-containing protein n=1 Tax=Laodelphax striatellus TaxID=195883 RepID=A0A482WVA4_LAOST|nr:hypothetical protein LSTR_LSTR011368 [Laodelphax striatellus]